MFYSEKLPKSPSSAGEARDLLDRLSGEAPRSVLDDARLLTSELVANAVEHVKAEGEIEVRIKLEADVLRVEVHDRGAGFTYTPRSADAGNERGWGLHFTDRMAKRWAIESDQSTCVWFELDVP